ncbi:MAG: MBL fold metallo-hydrolase [Hyphomicrobiales bacterium]|nr:MBL fold metallo-hydrolase [Hyphomicrobiales bacterium]
MNSAVGQLLDFGDQRDFEDAQRGFVAALEPNMIAGAEGRVVWDMDQYAFLADAAPDTVNASLWRQAQLNRISGLFTIHPRIHQVRGHDISNMTLIEGDTGWILIDPLTSVETASASLKLANDKLGARPVKAVIYTHSHADHFGGVRGVVDEADVKSGKVPIVAPDGFLHYAVSENVMAGNAMNRRAFAMYGAKLAVSPFGHVCCGLGKALPRGTISLIAPTDIVKRTGETRRIDGVDIEFQMANGSEAPAEFMFYFPQFRALCASEVTSHNMHNILTPRGAEVRNALHWSKYIDETIDLFADRTDLLFASHHWPTWGAENIVPFLARQRDLYRFIHDETLRLANHGYNMEEIAETLELPPHLAREFACRGYYGTLRHNVKGVFQFYLGWWDGNPALYDRLPRVEAGKRFVKAMGGAKKVIAEGKRAFDKGDYRWAAEVMNHLVFAAPENAAARALQADILEQMGYQSESGPWRDMFLTGALELRGGLSEAAAVSTAGADVLSAVDLDMLLDFLGVKFNATRAREIAFSIALELTDTGQVYAIEARNGVLNNRAGRSLANPDVRLRIAKTGLLALFAKKADLAKLAQAGAATVSGDAAVLAKLFGLLDDFTPDFPLSCGRPTTPAKSKGGARKASAPKSKKPRSGR